MTRLGPDGMMDTDPAVGLKGWRPRVVDSSSSADQAELSMRNRGNTRWDADIELAPAGRRHAQGTKTSGTEEEVRVDAHSIQEEAPTRHPLGARLAEHKGLAIPTSVLLSGAILGGCLIRPAHPIVRITGNVVLGLLVAVCGVVIEAAVDDGGDGPHG
ncbi:MAG: hypothetical protein L0J79_03195 [Propionibacterium sp.]|nr:hypothetical protein [Propionibacterium sp.]